jgi:hypothetical protein
MSVNEGGIASGHTYCHTYPLHASAVPVTPITTLLYVAVARRKWIARVMGKYVCVAMLKSHAARFETGGKLRA